MKSKYVFGLFLLFFSFTASANWGRDRGFHRWYFNGGYGAYGGYNGYFSSTAAEGYLRGMGAYFDGLGNLHVSNSIAARHFQEAYTRYLENQKLRVKTYYELRDIHDEWVKKKAGTRLTKDQLEKIAKSGLPARLRADQRNATTGALAWPNALKGKEFDADRAEIEAQFTERQKDPSNSGAGSDSHLAIKEATDDMLAKLAIKVRQGLNATAYVEANRFIKTLAYEARFEVES